MLWHNALIYIYFLLIILTCDNTRWALLKPVSVPWYRTLEPNSKDCSSMLSSTIRCSCRFCWRSNRAEPNTVCNLPVCQIWTYSPVCCLCNARPASLSSLFRIAVATVLSSPRSDSCWPVFSREHHIWSSQNNHPRVCPDGIHWSRNRSQLTNISSNLSFTVSLSILSMIQRCCSISLKSSPEWGRGIVLFPEPLLTPPPRPDFFGRPNHVSSWNEKSQMKKKEKKKRK